MLLSQEYMGAAVDTWSLGVVLYSMVFAVFPFANVADIVDARWAGTL